MTRSLTISILVFGLTILPSCSSSGPRSNAGRSATKIKHDEEEVPEQVRAIETQIDLKSALVAEEIEISISRNYEWDVALTGNKVEPQKPDGQGGFVSVANGNARAMFRNLDLRGYRRITFRKSGFDVVPFIRITAAGGAAHAIDSGRKDTPRIRRARIIRINNADIEYIDERNETAASVGPGPRSAAPKRVR